MAHPRPQWNSFDLVELKCAEHLLEQPDVAELLAKVIAAHILGRRPLARHGRDAVPDGRNPGPFVSGELIEEGKQQGLAVEAPGIVHHPDAISVEAFWIGEWLAAPDRQVPESRQRLLLTIQILLAFADLARMIVTVDPVVLEIVPALPRRGWSEDRSLWTHTRKSPANTSNQPYP